MRHQNRPEPGAAADFDRLAQRHAVAAAQRVDVVHEQDRVADDDAGEHDDADVRLHVERGSGDEQAEHDADAATGIENMMMNGSRSDSHLRRHHRVDEQHREHQHQQELPEARACSSTSAPKPTAKSGGTRTWFRSLGPP